MEEGTDESWKNSVIRNTSKVRQIQNRQRHKVDEKGY